MKIEDNIKNSMKYRMESLIINSGIPKQYNESSYNKQLYFYDDLYVWLQVFMVAIKILEDWLRYYEN